MKITRLAQLWLRLVSDAAYVLYMDHVQRLVSRDKKPMVSIVVPLFNEERFIGDCLSSLIRQTYDHWECIIVDDASTDESVTVAEKLIGDDSRFVVRRHEVNRGLAASRNTGLASARGEMVTFLDADDFLFSSSLWQRVHALLRESSEDVAGSFFRTLLCDERAGVGTFFPERLARHRGTDIDFITAKGECPFNAHAPMLLTRIVKEVGGFNEEMRAGAEDWDLWQRILRLGYRFVPSYGYGGAYRQKRHSMVRRLSTGHAEEALRLIDRCYRPMDENELPANGPYPFVRPLPFYEQRLIECRRLLLHAYMRFLDGDRETAKALLGRMGPGMLFLVRRHIDVDGTLRVAARRHRLSAHAKMDGVPLAEIEGAFRDLVSASSVASATVARTGGLGSGDPRVGATTTDGNETETVTCTSIP